MCLKIIPFSGKYENMTWNHKNISQSKIKNENKSLFPDCKLLHVHKDNVN